MRPHQTTGKNATDSALIIDAMDFLYTADINGFCIASSDSDYTRLATRIRVSNKFVLGIGRLNTPPAFVNACNVFVHTEALQNPQPTPQPKATSAPTPVKQPPTQTAKTKDKKKFKKLLAKAFESTVQGDGWAHLGAIGASLHAIDPNFDPRTYGHKQLLQLVRAYPDFIEVKKPDKLTHYIRVKA